MGDFQTATDRFLAWFKSVGGEFREDLIQIRDLRTQDAGRGIVTIKDIPYDTILFTIPRGAIINVQTSKLPKKLPKVFTDSLDEGNEGSEPLDPWASMILVMIFEFLQGEASRWKPYLDVLPESFDTPIFWSQSELKELEGTCLTTEKIGKQASGEMLRSRIIPVVLENSAIFYPAGTRQLNEDELLQLAHRMGSIIMAYAFDLDDENEDDEYEEDGWAEDKGGQSLLGMVPMADILNANADFNAHVNHGDELEVTALRSDTKEGTEILNYYGPLPSSELLRRYGYVTPEHRRYDVVEIPWTLVRSTICNHFDLTSDLMDQIEAQYDEDDLDDHFIIERDSGDPTSEGRLTYPAKLQNISPELTERLKSVLKAVQKMRPELISDKAARDEASQNITYKVLVAKLNAYPTSIEFDEDLLKRQDVPKRVRMAVEVRLGEKILLQEAINLVENSKKRQGEPTDERATKRAKR